MTLKQIYDYLEGLALQVPDIKSVVENDVTRINEMREVKYGVFAIQQSVHNSEQGWMNFSLVLFVIDRLVNSGENEVQVQSHSLEVLRAILEKAKEELEIDTPRYTTFTERFQDLCAGAWAEVVIHTPVSDCNQIFNR